MTTTSTITNSGHSVAAGEGERIWIVGDTMTFKATGESTGGSHVLLENVTAPGGGPPPHIHTREDEFWYVLDGTFEIRIVTPGRVGLLYGADAGRLSWWLSELILGVWFVERVRMIVRIRARGR